jgi:hypothetical protein
VFSKRIIQRETRASKLKTEKGFIFVFSDLGRKTVVGEWGRARIVNGDQVYRCNLCLHPGA